jgi:hypothetical protein
MANAEIIARKSDHGAPNESMFPVARTAEFNRSLARRRWCRYRNDRDTYRSFSGKMRELSDILSEANCEQSHSWISLELDGELSEFEQALLAAHLERCAACQRFQAALLALSTGLRDTPPAALNRPVSVSHRLRRQHWPPLAAALLAGCALASASLLTSLPASTPPGPELALVALHDGNLPTPTGLSPSHNQTTRTMPPIPTRTSGI